jgi:hypothetical protein
MSELKEYTVEAKQTLDVTGQPIKLGDLLMSSVQSQKYVYINSGRVIGITLAGKVTLELLVQVLVHPDGTRQHCPTKKGAKASFYPATLFPASSLSYQLAPQ